ncbi:hypothetical protein OPT61_g6982 [Boeremia exigua]|uniref:Uncharacterized protein n=1 Tax=Boeremia exigua TaxID=749465 RepID=A0ACC2I410_9PLEO|nr:hypothetical protein OPT61_g6982 [Boeremia exigua]
MSLNVKPRIHVLTPKHGGTKTCEKLPQAFKIAVANFSALGIRTPGRLCENDSRCYHGLSSEAADFISAWPFPF